MRHIERLCKPRILEKKGAEWTEEFLKSHKKRPDHSKYAHKEIVETLEEMSSHKCFYCEAKLDGNKEVDHHVEVSVDRTRAYDWDNLYLSCKTCNREKLDERMIPTSETLDPCDDSDETISETMSFIDEQIVSIDGNERGTKTIQKYRLDRDLLDLQRARQLQKINECVIRIQRDMIAESRKEMTEGERQMLRTFMSRQSPFSLMARIFLEKRGWLNQWRLC